MRRRRETPIRRVNPSGREVWVARYTNRSGVRVSAGTFRLRREAQDAIDAAYAAEQHRREMPDTVGDYFETWTERHPRSERTNATNEHRIGRVLDVRLEGIALRDWPYRDLRRRHAHALLAHMLTEQQRARNGAVNILRALSAMTEDAITDEVAEVNFVRGVRVRANDPRIRARGRPARVFSFEDMHRFAGHARAIRSGEHAPARDYEALVRTFTDTGMRLGEVLPLERDDLLLARCDEPWCRASGAHFHVTKTAHEGRVSAGTKTDHGEDVPGRVAPCPPTLERLLRAMPARIDTALLFATPTGRLWRERNFYRDVWQPAREAAGMDIRPHDCRHSYVSHLRAAGVDDADLAAITGHTIETMLARYTHPLRRSFDQVRDLIG
jgi:integrase